MREFRHVGIRDWRSSLYPRQRRPRCESRREARTSECVHTARNRCVAISRISGTRLKQVILCFHQAGDCRLAADGLTASRSAQPQAATPHGLILSTGSNRTRPEALPEPGSRDRSHTRSRTLRGPSSRTPASAPRTGPPECRNQRCAFLRHTRHCRVSGEAALAGVCRQNAPEGRARRSLRCRRSSGVSGWSRRLPCRRRAASPWREDTPERSRSCHEPRRRRQHHTAIAPANALSAADADRGREPPCPRSSAACRARGASPAG